MAEATIQFQVAKTPDEVFPFISDLEKAIDWVPDLISVEKVSEGEIAVGTLYQEFVRVGKKTGHATLVVTEFEPNRVFAHKGQGGPSRFTGRFLLEPHDGGTRITYDYSVKMTGFSRLLTPVVGRWIRKNSEAAIQNLQKALSK